MRRIAALGLSATSLVALVNLAILSSACSSDDTSAAPATPTAGDAATTDDAQADAAAPAPSCDPYAARSTPVEVAVGPTDLETAILAVIDGAKSSLDIMAPEIGHKPIAQAISKAKDRGVALRVIVDASRVAELAPLGDVVRAAPSALPGLGAKLLMADGVRALVTSAELAEIPLTKERHYAATIQEADDLSGLRAVFEQDWSGAGGPAKVCGRLVVSPGQGHDLAVDHVAAAEERLDLEADTVTDPRLVEAIKGRAGQGFPVRVLLAGPEVVSGTDSVGADLASSGVEVRYFRSPNVGSRLIVTERGALIGSHALSAASLGARREISLVVAGDAPTEKIRTQFDADWGKAALR